ncbi:MAG: ethylbenzene dehydrogenase-related protein [Candidatus Zixiibacteriota bacterium]
MTNKWFLILVTLVFGLLLLGVTGCDGISGDRGGNGIEGPQGPDYVPPIPANRFFSMAIANNSQRSHNGAPKLYLSFDSTHQAAGDTVFCSQLAKGEAPLIDGEDSPEEWGDEVTQVHLTRAAGDYNFIESAQVRSAFDNEFIYFQVKWAEVVNEEFGIEVSNSNNPQYWIYPEGGSGNAKRWQRSTTNEDRLNLFFEITPVTRYSSDGCYVTCHTNKDVVAGNFHATRGSRERMDIWHWTSATSNFTGYALDRYMDNGLSGGVRSDVGTPVFRDNRESFVVDDDTTDRPLYMGFDDPNSNSTYPLWDYQIRKVATSGWTPGATVPGFVSSIPWGSTADVEAIGNYIDGTWTVEMKRKRITGNGDDVKF